MSTYPNAPRLTRGAIVGIDQFNPLASIIVFQYNPETLRRVLTPRYAAAEAERLDLPRMQGPPRESITMSVEIDATDQLEQGEPLAGQLGIHPVLASLEMLLYPKSAYVIANEVLSRVGAIEVIPPTPLLTLVVWGAKRVVPVKLTTFSIEEQQYDPSLNPIRAKVELGMDLLTYHDLGLTSVGGSMFMAHQVVKETMGVIGSINGSLSALS